MNYTIELTESEMKLTLGCVTVGFNHVNRLAITDPEMLQAVERTEQLLKKFIDIYGQTTPKVVV